PVLYRSGRATAGRREKRRRRARSAGRRWVPGRGGARLRRASRSAPRRTGLCAGSGRRRRGRGCVGALRSPVGVGGVGTSHGAVPAPRAAGHHGAGVSVWNSMTTASSRPWNRSASSCNGCSRSRPCASRYATSATAHALPISATAAPHGSAAGTIQRRIVRVTVSVVKSATAGRLALLGHAEGIGDGEAVHGDLGRGFLRQLQRGVEVEAV